MFILIRILGIGLFLFSILSCSSQNSSTKEEKLTLISNNKTPIQNTFTPIWRKQAENGTWGYVDDKGNEIIKPFYTQATDFKNGFARVKTKYTWTIINTQGKHITTIMYSSVGDFSEERAGVKLGTWGVIDEKGKQIVAPKYTSFYAFSDGRALVQQIRKWGFIDRNGKEIIPLKYDFANPFSEGLARVNEFGKEGFINTEGKVIIPLKYDSVKPFGEGLALVGSGNNPYHFIDKEGNTVFSLPDSLSGGVFNEGLAMVTNGYRYGYIDKTGKIIIPLDYEFTIQFSEGLAAVKKNKKWGFIDKNGHTVIPFIYDDDPFGRYELFDFKNGYTQVMKGDSITLIDKKGKEIRHIGVLK